MRRFAITAVLGSSVARAEVVPPPKVVADADAELLAYVAEAERLYETNKHRETIVVEDTASPVDTPTSGVRTVDRRAIELTPHKNTDDLLRLVPGLYTSQHGSEGKGQQFFLRGFDAVHGADLAIRVGGIPINELSNVHGQGYADLGFVIPEAVDGIIARKGPFDLEQGWFATAGAIDIALGTRRGRRVSYELGTTNRHRVVAIEAPRGASDAEFVAVDAMHDDGFGQTRQAEHVTLLGQTELTAGRLRLRPMFAGYRGTFGEPGVVALEDIRAGLFARTDAPAGNLGGTSSRVLVGLGTAWKHRGDEIISSTYFTRRGLDLDENFTGFSESDLGDGRRQMHRALTGGGRVAWRHRLSPAIRLLTGLEVAHDRMRQSEDRVSIGGEIWRNERALEAITTSGGGWAGLEVKQGKLAVVGGARLDALLVDARDQLDPMRNGSGVVAAVSPKLAGAWRDGALALTAAIGRGVRPPEARSFTVRPSHDATMPMMPMTTYDGGDPEITKADGVELGAELRGTRLAAGVTSFGTKIDRESVFDHVSGVSAMLDGSRRLGVEAFVAATPLPYLALRGDVTVVDARFVVTNNPVPGVPRLLGTVEARFDAKPWSAGLAGRFVGPRPLIHGATAGSSTVVDAVAGWTRGRVGLQLQVDNLLGTDWNEGEYHFASRWDPAAPRSELPRVHISPGRPFGVRAGMTVSF